MKACVFCKIIEGKIPSHKVWEDGKHLAILDIFPNTKGMTVLITKKHYDSYAFDMPEKEMTALFKAAKKVARLLDRKLKVKRTALVMEGMGINHAHLKLCPLHGLDSKFKEMYSQEKRFFGKYEGYVSTIVGHRAEDKDLKKLAEFLRK